LGSPLCILQRALPCLLCRPEYCWGTTLLASKVFMTLCWWFGGFWSSLLNKLKIPTCLKLALFPWTGKPGTSYHLVHWWVRWNVGRSSEWGWRWRTIDCK
jgi:hypothetical protein